jgi:hypothetical protein
MSVRVKLNARGQPPVFLSASEQGGARKSCRREGKLTEKKKRQ